jgi:hypothetical protein
MLPSDLNIGLSKSSSQAAIKILNTKIKTIIVPKTFSGIIYSKNQ